jgi:hypothetical protein
MKMTTAEDKETTIGRSVYRKNLISVIGARALIA